MPAAFAETTRPADAPILAARPMSLSQDFNRSSFLFDHGLVGHPLFTLDRLASLAQTLLGETGARNVRWQASGAPVDAGWDVPLNEKVESVNEAIANLENSGSWVLLYSVQRDPQYQALLDQLMREILAATGVASEDVTWQDAYIFLASPSSRTPYHIDHEATFLFQVHGRRAANIWDQADRSVLLEEEIERYYAGDLNAAKYREENQSKAKVYDLVQGKGVHHPSKAPHWFQNGDTYSIALGVHFCLRDSDREAAPYQINHLIRKVGLTPTAPGQSPWRDGIKASLIDIASKKNPTSKTEMLRSGYKRLTLPLRLVGIR